MPVNEFLFITLRGREGGREGGSDKHILDIRGKMGRGREAGREGGREGCTHPAMTMVGMSLQDRNTTFVG